MKKIAYLLFITAPFVSFSQSENEVYKYISKKFEAQYNENEYQKLYDSFSPEMQAALPIERTTEFVNGLKAQAGKIKEREFLKY